MSTATLQVSAQAVHRIIPMNWNSLRDILFTDRHEGHRLLLHLLDQVHSKELSLLDLGIVDQTMEEEVVFISKLEGIALFNILAERYGLEFGFTKQTSSFLTNKDIFDLAQDLGIHVKRSDLPWALDVVALDAQMHDAFELPPEILPLDTLFLIASRVKDWYEETVGNAMAYQGRHKMVLPAEVQEFLKETLTQAYNTYLEEIESGVETPLAQDVVRRSLGASN